MDNRLINLCSINKNSNLGDWRAIVDQFCQSVVGQKLLNFLANELDNGKIIFPNEPLRALELTKLSQVNAVILGQDPYHVMGQANGLAFSVAADNKIPPSLRNIFKELQSNLSCHLPKSGDLTSWAEQGVLLLNNCLTVEQGLANSHANAGWNYLTNSIIIHLNKQKKPILFLLWGKHAQSKRILLSNPHHKILLANHPSPLSATKPPIPFIGCGHFKILQQWLQRNGKTLLNITGKENQKELNFV